MADLKTDYVDDVLDTDVNETRIFNIVDSNGNVVAENVHFVDNTTYTTTGDSYGSAEINEQNETINQINTDLTELDTNLKATNETAGVSDVPFKFGIDDDGNYGYYKDGADSVTPFKNPTGSKSITANGTYDVTDYASAVVNVGVSNLSGSVVYAFTSSGSNADGSKTYSYSVSASGLYMVIVDASHAYGSTSLSASISLSGQSRTLFNNVYTCTNNGYYQNTMRIALAEFKSSGTITMTTVTNSYTSVHCKVVKIA